MSASSVVAFVFARAGSKGVPGKNLKEIGGVSLVGHAVETALQSQAIDRVIVSTDSREIADVAVSHGAEAPWLRPAGLATDSVSEWLAWRHAVDAVEEADGPFELFVSVPATAPLRLPDDIDRAVARFRQSVADVVVTVTEASASPWFNLVLSDAAGELSFAVADGGNYVRRQDAPTVYELTPVAYVTTPTHIREAQRLFDGTVVGLAVPPERAIDVDTELDLAFAEFLWERTARSMWLGSQDR